MHVETRFRQSISINILLYSELKEYKIMNVKCFACMYFNEKSRYVNKTRFCPGGAYRQMRIQNPNEEERRWQTLRKTSDKNVDMHLKECKDIKLYAKRTQMPKNYYYLCTLWRTQWREILPTRNTHMHIQESGSKVTKTNTKKGMR